MRVLGLAGWSGSGKTTLLTAMLPLLIARGLRVSTVKHTHHRVDLDQPGKDSFRHRQAGAHEVLVASSARWALLHEFAGEEPGLDALLTRLAPVDLVLVEGFKASRIPKIEVFRASLGEAPLWPGRDDVVAVACDTAPPDCDRPVLPLHDAPAIVDWVTQFFAIIGPPQPAA